MNKRSEFKDFRFIFFISILLSTLFLISASQPPKRLSMAVLNLKTSTNLSKTIGVEISDRVRTHLAHIEKFTVLDVNKMNILLNERGFMRPSGCRSVECHSTTFDSQGTVQFLEGCGLPVHDAALEIGNMLGVDKVIYGLVNNLNDRYTIIIKIIDVLTGDIEITEQISYKFDVQDLDKRIDELAARIADKISDIEDSKGHLNKGPLNRADVAKGGGGLNFDELGAARDMDDLRAIIKNKIKENNADLREDMRDKMVFVPAGTFLMGNNEVEEESPGHEVFLDAFLIDKYEVTNAQYERFLAATNHRPPPTWGRPGFSDPNQPVVGISWEAANEYASWRGKRLPTEAEWEKAARGTDGRKFPWGNEWEDAKCHAGKMSGPSIVGNYPAGISPYGCYDMAGNVWEWCADWYSTDYYTVSPKRNPRGPGDGSWHILRGGGWNSNTEDVSTTRRRGGCPDGGYKCAGFRCVKDVKREEQ